MNAPKYPGFPTPTTPLVRPPALHEWTVIQGHAGVVVAIDGGEAVILMDHGEIVMPLADLHAWAGGAA